ncbi:MAG: type II toxin-antitoxin system RelE/ParE family toxin [Sulfurimonadaceae bacterium]
MLNRVVASSAFRANLSKILKFIAKDSKTKATRFKNALQKELQELPYMPLKYRKSIYFENETIRDFIFKGYCIPYLIEAEHERIILLDIIKWEKR